jgi:hypothetical protein
LRGATDADLRPALLLVLANAPHKLTRQEILNLWPPTQPRPAPSTLWGWLDRAVAAGTLLREGTGERKHPFRFWTAEREEFWMDDPLYRAEAESQRLLQEICEREQAEAQERRRQRAERQRRDEERRRQRDEHRRQHAGKEADEEW